MPRRGDDDQRVNVAFPAEPTISCDPFCGNGLAFSLALALEQANDPCPCGAPAAIICAVID
eukprot:scaffold1690_cov118-Isochrysis_galbana.AAC.1